MFRRWLESLQIWAQAVADLDDTHEDLARNLEARVRTLEETVEVLRGNAMPGGLPDRASVRIPNAPIRKA